MKKVITLLSCIIILTLLVGCSMPFSNNKAVTSKPEVTPTPTPEAEITDSEDDTLTLEELVDGLNEEFQNMSKEDKVEAGLDGIDFELVAKDNDTLIWKVSVDGIASLVYSASTGDTDALSEYDDFLIETRDGIKEFEDYLIEDLANEFDIKIKNIEVWIMNDVNPDNKLAIIKNNQVVYDTVYNINLLDLGSSDN